jgi:hypothetical protein
MQQITPKRWYLWVKVNGIMYVKIEIFMTNPRRKPNFTVPFSLLSIHTVERREQDK